MTSDDPNAVKDLEFENERLKNELEKVRFNKEGSLAFAFLNLVSRYLIVGRGVSNATDNLIKKYKIEPFAIHDREIAEVVAAIVSRLGCLMILSAMIAILPTAFLIYQTSLLSNQNSLISEQLKLSKSAADLSRIEEVYYEDHQLTSEVSNGGAELKATSVEMKLLRVSFLNNTDRTILLQKVILRCDFSGEDCFEDPRGVSWGDGEGVGQNIFYKKLNDGPDRIIEIGQQIESMKAKSFQFYLINPIVTKSGEKFTVSPKFVFNTEEIEGSTFNIDLRNSVFELTESEQKHLKEVEANDSKEFSIPLPPEFEYPRSMLKSE